MTKREIKEKIEQRCKEEWNKMCESTDMFGVNYKISDRYRARWIVLEDLYMELFNESVKY